MLNFKKYSCLKFFNTYYWSNIDGITDRKTKTGHWNTNFGDENQ